MSSKPRILLFNPVKHALAQYKDLQESTAPEVVTSESREQFFRDCRTRYKDVIAIYRTSASGAVSKPLAIVDMSIITNVTGGGEI